ncbi:MAG: CBS domain-containing protein, partial [Alphaproteobacteria bacterium]|nr:CBS domain-containing protein [Alphaproteobacteria bacterium]
MGRILASPRSPTATCEATCTVAEAIDLLADHRIGALPTVEADSVVGIFSERDVVYQLREHGAQVLT